MIGGLISATLLTLVVLPALYAMFFVRRTSVKAALPLALFALLSVGSASAQELRVLTLDSAITIAHRSSPTMLAARASEASAQQLRRTGFELPNTEFQYMQGQFNSYVRDDNNITIQQRLPFPTAVAARSGLVKAEAESATAQRRVSEADLIVYWFTNVAQHTVNTKNIYCLQLLAIT